MTGLIDDKSAVKIGKRSEPTSSWSGAAARSRHSRKQEVPNLIDTFTLKALSVKRAISCSSYGRSRGPHGPDAITPNTAAASPSSGTVTTYSSKAPATTISRDRWSESSRGSSEIEKKEEDQMSQRLPRVVLGALFLLFATAHIRRL